MKINKVTNKIKELRFENDNMSQQLLADIVGCSRQTINVLKKQIFAIFCFNKENRKGFQCCC